MKYIYPILGRLFLDLGYRDYIVRASGADFGDDWIIPGDIDRQLSSRHKFYGLWRNGIIRAISREPKKWLR